MILNYERSPQYSLFYIGAKILKTIDSNNDIMIDTLYEQIKAEYNNDLSITYFYLALDWLYLVEAIEIIDNKVVRNEN